MSFDALLGNERLRENLATSLQKGHISHFYLICGPKGSGKHTLARLLAAAILCRENGRPCMRCLACRKVMDGTHPDFITVDDPEKKTVPVDLIRDARADMFVVPNEADHKIYLFPRAQDMGVPGQNALLKILEEPPAYGVFLLLSDNPDKLLPTVRSRCVELRLQALPERVLRDRLRRDFPQAGEEDVLAAVRRSGGFLGQAAELLAQGSEASAQLQGLTDALVKKDPVALLQVLAAMEKWKRDPLAQELTSLLEVLEGALICRAGADSVSPQARLLAREKTAEELHRAVLCVKKALDYTMSNVSPGAVCGYLEWALR